MWNNARLVVAACCMAIPVAGVAQERVRVTLADGTISGVVTRMDPEVLELALDRGGSRMLSRGEVVRMERGFLRSRWHQGYLLGSAVGCGAGMAAVFGDDEYIGGSFLAVPLGLIAGGIAGSVIGAASKREVWETVQDWTLDSVRVALSGSERVVGVVSRVGRDGLELLVPGGSRLVAAGDVARIERRTVRRQWRRGFVVGAVVGGVLGLLVPIEWEDALSGEILALRVFSASNNGAFFGSVGTLVGGLFKREDWEPVQGRPARTLEPRLLVDAHTVPGGGPGVLVGAKLEF